MGRSISFDIAAVDKASKALEGVGKEVAQLGRRIDAAGGDIDVNTGEASRELSKLDAQLAKVDSQLAKLNAKSFKIDADTKTAERNLAVLEAELKRTTDEDRQMRLRLDIGQVQARLRQLAAEKVAVDVETGAAQAEVNKLKQSFDGITTDAAQGEVEQLEQSLDGLDDGHRKIDVDVSGAIASVGKFIAILGAIPAVTTVAVAAVGAVAGAGIAVGAGAVAAVSGFKGIGDAVTAMGEKATAGGGAVKASASAIRSATQGVVDARRGLTQANERVVLAEEDLKRAQEDAKRAQEGLNDAREDAIRTLQDYESRSKNMALDQESAALSVMEAKERLHEVRKDEKSDSLDIARAELAVREARQRERDLTLEATRLAEEKAKVDEKGVEGSDQVVAAQDRISDAQERVQAADRQVSDSRQQVIRATEQLAEAQLRLQETLKPKAASGGGGVDKLKEAMEGLGPKAREFARYLYDLNEGPLTRLRQAGQERFLPGVQDGLEAMEKQIPRITPAWASFSGTVGKMVGDGIRIGSELAPSMLRFSDASLQGLSPLGPLLSQFGTELGATLDRMSQTGQAQAAMQAVVDVVGALLPLLPQLIEHGAAMMAELGPGLTALLTSLSQSLGSNLPALVGMAGGMSTLLQAVAPLSPKLVTFGLALAVASKVGLLKAALDIASAGFDRLKTAANGTTTDLDGAGRASRDTETRLGGLSGAVTKLGAAYAAAAIASQSFDVGSGAGGINTTTAALMNLSRGVIDSSGTFSRLDEDLRNLGLNGREVGRVVEQVGLYGNLMEGSFAHVDERISAVDQALASMVTSGNAAQAAAAFSELARRAKEQGTDIGTLQAALPQYKNALDGVKLSADGTAGALGRMNQAHKLTAQEYMTGEQASIQYSSAVDRMRQSLTSNGTTLSLSTEKGRANRQALLDMVNAANGVTTAMQNQGAPLDQVRAKYEQQRASLVNVAVQAGMTRTQAQAYIAKLLETPKTVTTNVVANTSTAESRLLSLQNRLAALNGVLTVTPNTGGKGSGLGVYKSSGGWVPGQRSRVDTVPAMLAGREFVTNSTSSVRYPRTLEAINAGASPEEIARQVAVDGGAAWAGASAAPAQGGTSPTASGTTIQQPTIQVIVQAQQVLSDEYAIATAVTTGIRTAVSRGLLPLSILTSS